MERSKLTYNNMCSTNISQSIILPRDILKNSKKDNIIKHYKLIKNIRSQKENNNNNISNNNINNNKGVISNTLYLNNSKIKKKFKNLFNSPERRINSTRINPNHLYKRLKFLTLDNSNNSFCKNINKRQKIYKKLNSYYYSASIPMKNKYIVDNLNQDKQKTTRFKKENKVSVVQKKIDALARNLNLFQYKKKRNNFKNVRCPYTKRIQKISQKEFIQSYYDRQKDLLNNTKSSFPSIYNQQTFIDKTYYTKNSQKSTKTLKDNILIKENTEIPEKNDIKKDENNNDKIHREKEKKILKNAQTSVRFMEAQDEFFYKKIFEFNNINRKKKTVNVIDNKLNIFYSENLDQYNQKMNRINAILAQSGKPMIHQGVERNSKNNMEKMFKKIQFIKKIIDYVYPNMVLYKVKQEKKRMYKNKSLDFKFSRSRLNLMSLKEDKNKIDKYFSKSIMINKC